MKQFLEKLKKKENLSFNESKLVFNTLMNGEASEDGSEENEDSEKSEE